MKLLFDAYWWSDGPPSGRSVVRSMIGAWCRQFPEDQITVQVPRARVHAVSLELKELRIAAQVKPCSILGVNHAASVFTTRASGFDFFVAQNFASFFRSAKSVTLLHDLIFLDHPEWFTAAERAYLALIRPSLRTSQLILTTSQSETARIARLWPHMAGRLRRVGLGISTDLLSVTPRRPPALHNGHRPYILAVGRVNIRKNLSRLIAAYEQSMMRHTHDLHIVGPSDGRSAATLARSVAGPVVLAGAVSDGELAWYYRHADLFIFPSLDEGFGLPIIEARQAGAPVAASNIEAFLEYDFITDYFDPNSVQDMARSIDVSVGRNDDTPQALGDFTWGSVVERIRQTLEIKQEESSKQWN